MVGDDSQPSLLHPGVNERNRLVTTVTCAAPRVGATIAIDTKAWGLRIEPTSPIGHGIDVQD